MITYFKMSSQNSDSYTCDSVASLINIQETGLCINRTINIQRSIPVLMNNEVAINVGSTIFFCLCANILYVISKWNQNAKRNIGKSHKSLNIRVTISKL